MTDLDDIDDGVVDEAEDGSDDLLVCPACRLEVHEETQQCPHCGDWITPVYPAKPVRRALWVVMVIALVVVLAGLLALL